MFEDTGVHAALNTTFPVRSLKILGGYKSRRYDPRRGASVD